MFRILCRRSCRRACTKINPTIRILPKSIQDHPQNAGIAAKSAGVMDYQAKAETSDASKKVDQVKNCAIIVK
ncbi:hypothetical protein BEQ56_01115 [Anaerolineaceae bacterium oral taxon 439]|nr:hypothetical protein BEQ56_01115 [Anaerolineaceae bacterium oral taxon 439]